MATKQQRKATPRVQSIVDTTLERPLLNLHAAIDLDTFWKAVQNVIQAALPSCFIGLTLQHSPILPRIAKSTKKLSGSFFPITPIQKYFSAYPHRNIVFINDPAERKLLQQDFASFEKEWKGTGNWTLLAVPQTDHVPSQR